MSLLAEVAELEAERITRQLIPRRLLPFVQRFKPDYQAGWFHRRLCTTLERFCAKVEAGLSPRLMIYAPPRHGKSEIVSRAFPSWIAGKHPEWEQIVATYGQDLADDLGRWCKRTLTDPRFSTVFANSRARSDSAAASRIDLERGGGLRFVGVGGPLIGRGGNIAVIDDPLKNREEADSERYREATRNWYTSVLRTRLAPGGGIVLMHQRWHTEDLAGWLLETDPDGWEVENFPAIAEQDEEFRKKGEALHPERWPLKELEALRKDLSPRDWLAMYQQRPVSDEGGYFQKAWMRTYDTTPVVGEVYLAADMAYRTGQDNDRTCIAAFGMSASGDVVFLPGIVLDRLDTGASVEAILDLAKATGAQTLAVGRDMIQGSIGPFLSRRMNEREQWLTVEEIPQKTDKEARARSFQARMQQGKVLFPSGEMWTQHIQPELLAFPGGKHDDAVDMGAHACLLLDKMSEPSVKLKPDWKNPDAARWQEVSRREKREEEAITPLFGGDEDE